VLAGWDKNLYVWNFPVPWVEAAAQWPTLSHDPKRTGRYGYRIDSPTDAGEPEPTVAAPPAALFLGQNHPNPFNPMTTIEYGVPVTAAGAPVFLDVFDARGRHVRTLLRGPQAPGHYKAIWDGRDDRGAAVGSGIYFTRLRAGNEVQTRKAILMK